MRLDWAHLCAVVSIGAMCVSGSAAAAESVVVFPGASGWFFHGSDSESEPAITGVNPRSGFGSLELTKGTGSYSYIGLAIPPPGFGTFGSLNAAHYDWLIDPASSHLRPPEFALRVYDYGDSRSFFLIWDTCSANVPCADHPAGSWQTTNVIGRLSIQAADGNTPPASLAAIPLDAPIVEIALRSNYSYDQPWHGFADNVTIGFAGQSPLTYNFEIPPPRGVPPVKVLPDDPGWFGYTETGSTVAITGVEPGAGFGSLELTKAAGSAASFHREIPLPGFGTYGNLEVFNYDWLIDPAASLPVPPELVLRVYPYGDPRSFFLSWSGCCAAHPVGSWQTTNVMGSLSILPADGNTPPASLADIPPDAPIVGIHVWSGYAFGQAWHGFADNVTIGFAGQSPITYDFDVPPPRGTPASVVLPGQPSWFDYNSGDANRAAITNANPFSGFGSLELTRDEGADAYAGFGQEIPPPGLGTYGTLNVLNYDWFIDPASSRHRPPEFALRVYPYDDARSFFLYWDGCPPAQGCVDYPVGSWQTANLIGRLGIQAADGNTPPASLSDIPLDAPIVGVYIRVNYSDGEAWHGFVDNVTIGFTGQSPITYNFEIPPPRGVPPVRVLPGDPGWYTYNDSSSSAALTGLNPGAGFGSLEMTRGAGNNSFAGIGWEPGLPGLGNWGNLNVLNFDWFLDPASGQLSPPAFWLQLYPNGDSRRFYLSWDGCNSPVVVPCDNYPAGSWQTTDLIGRMSIAPADGTTPPASVADIPPDAPIVAIWVESNFASGQAWHGFADNATIGFTGQAPVTYDFEIPPPRGIPSVVIFPGAARWFSYSSDSSNRAEITAANPVSGFGSLELTRAPGAGYAGMGTSIPLPGFGTFGSLNVANYDWFIDPASSHHWPPEFALRVYPYGDSRSFFLSWNGCTATQGCVDYPAGSWQTTNLIGRFSIQAADGNTPPASLADIPLDAPIVGVDIRANYSDGLAWHGFADNVTIGFTGRAPITFNLEIPAPRGTPAVVVLPGDPDWFAYLEPGSSAGITGVNPGSGFGSLELTKGVGSALSFVREIPLPGFGTFGTLNVLNFDWLIDPASSHPLPPALALRVYPAGDSRSFFLAWNTCCTSYPAGAWQTTNLIGRLSIQPADGNTPPASLADIPPEAPIVGIHIWGNHSFGQAWHAFVDNVTIGFIGHAPITWDFEVPTPRGIPPILVRPNDPGWFTFSSGSGSGVAISTLRPRSGAGSLRLTRGAGQNSWAGAGREIPLPGFGTFANLSVLNFDWLIDPANSHRVPPLLNLRVYPYDDPRSFFVGWNGCDATRGCVDRPAGTWQTTNVIGQLSITQADDNPPPASLADIPPDAPIVAIFIDSPYSFGEAWRGFVDNVTLGFVGQLPVTFNFEPVGPPDLVFRNGFEP